MYNIGSTGGNPPHPMVVGYLQMVREADLFYDCYSTPGAVPIEIGSLSTYFVSVRYLRRSPRSSTNLETYTVSAEEEPSKHTKTAVCNSSLHRHASQQQTPLLLDIQVRKFRFINDAFQHSCRHWIFFRCSSRKSLHGGFLLSSSVVGVVTIDLSLPVQLALIFLNRFQIHVDKFF